METKEKDDLISQVEDSDIQDDFKRRIIEYFKSMKEEGFDFKNEIVYSIPGLWEKEGYSMNRVFNFSRIRKKIRSHWEVVDKSQPVVYLWGKSGTGKSSMTVKALESFPDQKSKVETTSSEEILIEQINQLREEQSKIAKETRLLKETISTIVVESNLTEKKQFIPVDIFLDTNEHNLIFEVYSSVIDFLITIGFEKNIELDAIRGSWYKKFVAKSKKAMTDKEVTDRLKEMEYALEVKILKDQSEVDKNQSEALSNILKSVENISNAAIKIGSLLVVKITSESGEASVQVRSLSILELHLLNKRPDLLLKPKEILQALARMIETENSENKDLN